MIRMVDVGLAGDEMFLSHKSYGFIDQIQERVEEGRRQPRDRTRRLLAYYAIAVRAVWTTPLRPLAVEVDGAGSPSRPCWSRWRTWRRTATCCR